MVERNIIEPGKLPLLLALASFVLTFVITRVIVRLIRAGKGPFGNVKAGGLHIHHVVPGVVLTVIGGFGAVAAPARLRRRPVRGGVRGGRGTGARRVRADPAPGRRVLERGGPARASRSSSVTAALVGLVLAGFLPFGVDDKFQEELQDRGGVILSVAVNFLFALLALSKGKARMAIFGVIVPFVALIGAVRLARPGLPVGQALLPSQAARPGQVDAARLPPRPPLVRPAPQASGSAEDRSVRPLPGRR